MERFVKLWGDVWEKDDRAPEIPWMESVSKQLRDKITSVKEFNITRKRKNWTAPGMDGIQNFC